MTMDLVRGVRFAMATMLLFGGAYPFAVWGLAQTAFRHQAQGSLVMRADGSIIGSTLIAQPFEGEAYVHPRPSAVDYNAASTGGTNFGPTNPDHLKAVGDRVAAVRQREMFTSGAIPADLVTASGAGLDPHLSPAAVDVQVARVARARGVSVDVVRQIVAAHTEPPTFGVLGRSRVNVLQLNLALDADVPRRADTRQDSTHE
ncbi:Potassium-transporting ATPase C chain [Luteitalea pratensis]|uniref:Potassium-transporting ATPase KdpC subunit n=1 Tax=Luteitalea pratensis TaxID=1855912 RepID=A0A143PMM3_LUTPR|nr:potassium-transporting ATPase subunit KdpC [Luteitalea pratensis]AMY09842.1 Potassium-transporting ATPase C chain [Luteitalea pratensis]